MRSKFFKITIPVICAVAALLLIYFLLTGGRTGREAGRPTLPDGRVFGRGEVEGLPIEEVRVNGVPLSPSARKEWIAERVRRNKTRILLVGIDGADWDIIMPLIEKGELKNFQHLLKTGVHGYLESMQPILSPIIWTSIATGKLPEKHGILDFTVTDTAREKKIPTTSNFRRTKALWNILSDYDRSVGFVGWLASWPAEKVKGFNVSDRLCYHSFAYMGETEDVSEGLVYPDSLMELVKKYSRRPEDVRYGEVRRFVKIKKKVYDQSFSANVRQVQPRQ